MVPDLVVWLGGDVKRYLCCVRYHSVTFGGMFYHLGMRDSQDFPFVMVKGKMLRLLVDIGITRG